MAMHLTPEEHHADPPDKWTVRKQGRRWALCGRSGAVIDSFDTKTKAEAAKTSGMYFDLYQKEGRWFRGEPVSNWKPYQPKIITTPPLVHARERLKVATTLCGLTDCVDLGYPQDVTCPACVKEMEAIALGFESAAQAAEHVKWLEKHGTPEYHAWKSL